LYYLTEVIYSHSSDVYLVLLGRSDI